MPNKLRNLPIRVLDATKGDLAFIESHSKEFMLAPRKGKRFKTLVARHGGEVVGFVQIDGFPLGHWLRRFSSTAVIDSLSTRKGYENRRVGRTLLGKANAYALRNKFRKVVLDENLSALPRSYGAQGFYSEKTNYIKTGTSTAHFWIPTRSMRQRK
ncbi:Acetyltransferase (GNAT) family protein [uncultured archaeon]|nr:Acetyltransferase (GNAT) family protein [uncultured archaeon]